MKHYDIINNELVVSPVGAGAIVVASAPDAEERRSIKETFQLDDYDLGSTLDPDEVPRLENSKGRLFLIWKVPEPASVSGTVELGISTLGIYLVQDRLMLVRASGDVGFADREFRGVRNASDVMLAILLRTVRHCVGHLRVIRQMSRELEKKITTSMENRHLVQMFSLNEALFTIRTLSRVTPLCCQSFGALRASSGLRLGSWNCSTTSYWRTPKPPVKRLSSPPCLVVSWTLGAPSSTTT